MSLIRLHDCPPQPWKNGLGSTRELAVYPSNSNGDTFLWRVSVAMVDSAAPFSVFPGIDRHIALLRGAGFRMTLDEEREHALDTPLAPFVFPGEARVTTVLIDGPTEDFNLMVRRGQRRGSVEVWREAHRYDLDSDTVLVFCAMGCIDMAGAILQTGDAWQVEPHESSRPTLRPGAVALAVRVASPSHKDQPLSP